MLAGVAGSYSGRKEGVDCGSGRPPRVGAIVAGFAFGLQSPRDESGSTAGYGRRRLGILESVASGLVNDTNPTLLGSQDGQDKLPKSQHGAAKKMLHNIYLAETRAQAEKAFDLFLEGFGAKHSKATECLAKDRSELLAFYDFPAEHWMHFRSTNPIESVFATVRLRTYRTKGSGSALACETMVFKLMRSAAKRWRALNGSELLAEVIAGVKFVDGIKENAA